jgi:hypothetical protein
VWSVIAIVVLYRIMPIIAAANATTMRDLVIAFVVAAIAAPLFGLFGNNPRSAMALASSGAAGIGAALVIHAYQEPNITVAVVGVACVLAVAPARAAAVLATSAIAAAMRTDDMAEMGDGLRRMRASTLALLLSALVISLSGAAALAFSSGSTSRFGLLLGEAVFLVAVAAIRVFFAIAIGPLRRRRAFEPDRVREAASASLSWPYWLALAGAILVVASLVPSWLGYLDGQKHNAPHAAGIVLWAGVAVLGIVVTAASYAYGKDGALRASAVLAGWLDALLLLGAAAYTRFISEPIGAITDRVDDGILAGDWGLARAATASGRLALATARAPAVPLIIVVVALLALVVGLVTPGVFR